MSWPTGLVLLVAGQAIRLSYPWLLRQSLTVMLAEARAASDPDVFRRLERSVQHATATARSDALNKLTWIVIHKGGPISDITVGDCIELTTALEEHHFRGSAGRLLFQALLKETGVLPASAPLRLRALHIEGARGHHPAVAVAHGDDRVQVVGALGSRRTDDGQFGAGASGEVVGVHRGRLHRLGGQHLRWAGAARQGCRVDG